MDAYTIEDVELLRRKSGMTSQEAVALLEYQNGDLARALIDLEKSGRLKDERSTDRASAGPAAAGNAGRRAERKEKAYNFLQKMYQCRVKVHKGQTAVVNLCAVYAGIALLFAPHVTVIGIVLAMILGYRFSFSQMDADFAADSLKKTVKNAAENAKASVNSVVRSIKETAAAAAPAEKKSAGKQAPEIRVSEVKVPEVNVPEVRVSDIPFPELQVPTIQVPVQAEARDGSVQIDEDRNGYSSVTVG